MTIPTTAYLETTPVGSTTPASQIDEYFRELKGQVREILEIDHRMPEAGDAVTGQDAEMGRHKVVRLLNQTSAPSAVAEQGQLYVRTITIDTTDYVELFYTDNEGNEIRLTTGGVLDALTLTTDQTVTGDKTFEGAVIMDKENIDFTASAVGNATFTNGSTTVTGAGTAWDTAAAPGMAIRKTGDTRYYLISAVGDDTTIVLTESYGGETAIATYVLAPTINNRVPAWGGLAGDVTPFSLASLMVENFAITTYTGTAGNTTVSLGFMPDFVLLTLIGWHGFSIAFKEEAASSPLVGDIHNSEVSGVAVAEKWIDAMQWDDDGVTLVKNHNWFNNPGLDYVIMGIKQTS